ncbi:uncharacterized protein LY89DRAFT_784172 [Mollisia scopiformis]|uniref:2EXR domain-containing protein n=1 Tax=Mollisia scopiformis TaxID=149040 RepID=A0A194X1W4_MOLSC|nr:uncharacterized protein LY89DRAFT_784172 [Mollisia scopiformis]KUJ14181.1 hypothetical protein LY89DRAFT_784172 [Mollisia scopiformis]
MPKNQSKNLSGDNAYLLPRSKGQPRRAMTKAQQKKLKVKGMKAINARNRSTFLQKSTLPQPPPVFTCFSNLPAELRLKVWEFAAENEIQLMHKHVHSSGDAFNSWLYPSLSWTCRDSRATVIACLSFKSWVWAGRLACRLRFSKWLFKRTLVWSTGWSYINRV